MFHYTQFMLDQFAPIALYEKLKTAFPEEITFLFESGDGGGDNSIVLIGARSRLQYRNKETLFTNADGEVETLDRSAFAFLKQYYDAINPAPYKAICKKLDIGYADGFIGYIGYDMVNVFEPVLAPFMADLEDTLETPDLDLILPKMVAVYSHRNHKITLLTTQDSMAEKLTALEAEIKDAYHYTPLIPIGNDQGGSYAHTKSQFFDMVAQSKAMIESGDVFQILMTNRYTRQAQVDPFSFYRILRTKNPSPYMFLMAYEGFTIVGSSPEVMVRLQDNELLLRPIAGTRKRGETKEQDRAFEEDLLADPKELAEHLMLIDLGRNDVGRVAKTGSVKVEDMMHIERFSHVMHIVSDVTATLRDDKDMFDLFMATFTAGTMTGAPKIRAMELIAEFEGLKRGFYSGSVGYFGFDGNMDSAITIRTAMVKPDEIILQAGAGIVADSQPEYEYLEVQSKLGALMSSMEDLLF